MIFMYDHRGFFRHVLEFQSDRKAYMSDIASAAFFDDVADCISVVASNAIYSCVSHKNKNVG